MGAGLVVATLGCDGAVEELDAGVDAGECAVAADCDDGRFCNGAEACEPGATSADARGCVPGAPPCEGDCSEADDRCVDGCAVPDADGDGVDALACGGEDCDDTNALRYPGAPEVCDDRDDDCDPTTVGAVDADGDGFVSSRCCNPTADGELLCGQDCDDTRASTAPGAAEVCNGRDDDCDGATDEEVRTRFYRDFDGDGFGTDDEVDEACGAPAGFTATRGDCDDSRANVHPGIGRDGCDDLDNDCDGLTDEGELHMDPADDCACLPGETVACSVNVGACSVGAQVCDAIGRLGPCTTRLPGEVEEACDIGTYVDDDCDGVADEAPGEGIEGGLHGDCYFDADGDGVGSTLLADVCLPCAPGSVDVGGDCNDATPAIRPGLSEVCDGLDNDCVGGADDGFECAAGEVVSCEIVDPGGIPGANVCGMGTRACANDGSCTWAAPCARAEVCNYCDDDGDGSVSDEVPDASGGSTQFGLGGDAYDRDFGDAMGDLLIDGTADDQAGAQWLGPVVLGYGQTMVVELDMDVSTGSGGSGPPDSGWAFVVLKANEDDELPAANLGAPGDGLGVPLTTREGFAAEWRFNSSGTEVDALTLRAIVGDGTTHEIDFGSPIPTIPASERLDAATTGTVRQRIRLRLETTRTSGSFLHTQLGLDFATEPYPDDSSWVESHRCGAGSSEETCYVSFRPGDRVHLGLTAASAQGRSEVGVNLTRVVFSGLCACPVGAGGACASP